MGKTYKIQYEVDMYEPLKKYLTDLGYEVRSEVKDCDITALAGDKIIVVEMKLTLNLDVILQGVQRQKITDDVFIAVPKKIKALKTERWKNILYLLKRLGIGLLLVSSIGSSYYIEEALIPNHSHVKKSKRKSVLNEHLSRSIDLNKGGSTRKKILTGYKEKAIYIGVLLSKHDILSIKELKGLGADNKKTSGILQNDYYGWFERVSKGVYKLNEKGKKELELYQDIIKLYFDNL